MTDLLIISESRESVRVRDKRGKVTRASSFNFNSDVTQDLDANEEEKTPEIQTSFLSESVRKYLELGELARSIPGRNDIQITFYLITEADAEFQFHHIGRPGTDYPILSAIPYTNFYCDEQPYPGFFADMETRCQGK